MMMFSKGESIFSIEARQRGFQSKPSCRLIHLAAPSGPWKSSIERAEISGCRSRRMATKALPGPTSNVQRTRRSAMLSIQSSHRTVLAIWPASAWARASASRATAPVKLQTTAVFAERRSTLARYPANATAAGAMAGVCDANPIGSRVHLSPSAPHAPRTRPVARSCHQR